VVKGAAGGDGGDGGAAAAGRRRGRGRGRARTRGGAWAGGGRGGGGRRSRRRPRGGRGIRPARGARGRDGDRPAQRRGSSGLGALLTNAEFVRRPFHRQEADELAFVCHIVTAMARSIRRTFVSANVQANRPRWISHLSSCVRDCLHRPRQAERCSEYLVTTGRFCIKGLIYSAVISPRKLRCAT